MTNNRISGVYAKSLLDIANEQGNADAILADMQYLREISKQSREFQLMLQSPIIKADKKKTILQEVTNGNIQEVTSKFLNLLVSKGRESILSEIGEAYEQQYNDGKNIKQVNVITAVPMNEKMRNIVTTKAASIYPSSIIKVAEKVDASIIGGFIIEVGDARYDASVKSQLNNIKKEFSKNYFTQLS